MKYATWINSFLRLDSNLLNAFQSIGAIEGVDYVGLNCPEHSADYDIEVIKAKMEGCELKCNAINLRLRDRYIGGELGSHKPSISQGAIALYREAVDACRRLGGNQMTIWLRFDGSDYSSQIDCVSYWSRTVKAFRGVCDYSGMSANTEYKLYEEKVHTFIDSFEVAVSVPYDMNRENLGVTLDSCHILVKKGNPASTAAWLLEQGKLYDIHLSDGEGFADDGLMVRIMNFWKTVEVMYYLRKYDFQGVIYFDIFLKREKVVKECKADTRMYRRTKQLIDTCGFCRMEKVVEQSNAVAVSSMVAALL